MIREQEAKKNQAHLRVSLRSLARTAPVDCGSDTVVLVGTLLVVVSETSDSVRWAGTSEKHPQASSLNGA